MQSSVDFELARQQMVRDQLQRRGIHDPAVLNAMGRIPRERFVPEEWRESAYADQALPIEANQTISQPYIVGLMTEALMLDGSEHILEVGTGSGYQAAVLSQIAHDVVSIEQDTFLSAHATRTLAALGVNNVATVVGDGTEGWPEAVPYDRIIVTAAAAKIPPALFDQLAEGGIAVMPIGDSSEQELQQIRKSNGEPHIRRLTGCRFVPLLGAFQPE